MPTTMPGMGFSPSTGGLRPDSGGRSKPQVATRVEAHATTRVVGFQGMTTSGFKQESKPRRSSGMSDNSKNNYGDESVNSSSPLVGSVPVSGSSSTIDRRRSASDSRGVLLAKPRPIVRRPVPMGRSSSVSQSHDDSPVVGSSSVSKEASLSCSPRVLTNEAETQIRQFSAVPKSAIDGQIKELQKEYPVFANPLVMRAFAVASSAHDGQIRKNGEPVIVHCIETAKVLARLGMDERVVAAGLLHDTCDDTPMTENLLMDTIQDKEVIDLVKGVSKLSDMSQMHRDTIYDTREAENTSERWRSIVLAMCDVRIVLIKLADRLHNMQTLEALPHAKRIRFATETRTLFAPLANRLGVWSVKAELEDLCFKWLEPEAYSSLKIKMEELKSEDLIETLEMLRCALQTHDITFEDLSGRPKNLYSIYKKLKKKDVSLDEIYDKRAIRIIVDSEQLCYKAQSVVHGLWAPLAGKQKDYIQNKKANGYQSLHTVVRRTKNGDPLEVQIRTREMHHVAEHGIAAHWRYKESRSRIQPDAFIEKRVAWARWLLKWQVETDDQKAHISGGSPKAKLSPDYSDMAPSVADGEMEFLNMKNPWTDASGEGFQMCPSEAVNPGPVYVVLVNGYDVSVRQMPAGSTMDDLVGEVDLNGEYTFTRNNSEEFSYNQELEMGDVIELVYEAIPQASVRGGTTKQLDDQVDFDIDEMYLYSDYSVEKERARLTRMYNKMHDNSSRDLEPLGV